MRRNMLAFAFLGLSLCVSSEYFIEISPNNEPNYYKMKVDDTITFEVTAYEKRESSNFLVSLEEKVWWEYDLGLLQKVSQDNTSITLKAIREGDAYLCATTIVENNHCQKKISILIIK